MAASKKSSPTIGFLTVVESASHGLAGGYLILNPGGRPLEFHCTAPLKPSRAQQILYGPTLRPHLFGEQIGKTLVAKGRSKPLWVCTDVADTLSARPLITMPVVLVGAELESDELVASSTSVDGLPEQKALPTEANSPAPAGSRVLRFDAPHSTEHVRPEAKPSKLLRFRLGDHSAAVSTTNHEDRQMVTEKFEEVGAGLDLCEPFERIREALAEAQGS